MRHQKSVFALVLCCAVAGCGGGGGADSSSSLNSAPGAVVISVAPASASVNVGTGSAPFSAAVTNAQDSSVSWYVNGAMGGDAAVGTISNTGMYSAPASLPGSPAV